MSLNAAETLLRQYNKKDTASALTRQGQGLTRKLGSYAYANPYDAAYDKYSQNKNFNVNMWQEALTLGEQDKYIALLERNKDRTLSREFYDPRYYDYETNMLELYQPFAAVDDTTEYFEDVYNPVTGEFEEQSIGNMNSQQYIQYQLSQARNNRAMDLTKYYEQWRKDQMSTIAKIGHDALAVGAELGEGVLTAGASFIDVFAGLIGAAVINGETEDNYLDAYVEYFAKHGLTASEKNSIRKALDEYERTHTHFRDIDGNMTGIGKYLAGVSNSIGMMLPSIITGMASGGASFIPQAMFYTSLFGQNVYDNATNAATVGSPSWLKLTNAVITTGAEVAIEYGLQAIMGSTIQNRLMGMGGNTSSIVGNVTKINALKYLGKSALQEGIEEFCQDFSTELINQLMSLLYKGYGQTGVTFQTLMDSFFVGALSSIVMSGGEIARTSIARGIQNKREKGSGDTVIDVESQRKDGTDVKFIAKLTGAKELYFNHMLADFRGAIDQLTTKKISDKRSLALAQEIYSAFSVISQYYSSLTPERVRAMETLLDAVMNGKDHLTEMSVRDRAKHFGGVVSGLFERAYADTKMRHMQTFNESMERVGEEIAESGAKNILSVTDKDGETTINKDVEAAERYLSNKAVIEKLGELRQEYAMIFTTDGDLAVNDGDLAYVPIDWLQNYETSEIFKFLTQNRIIKAFLQDESLKPFVDKIVDIEKTLIKEDVTPERAVMNFLFNSSFYEYVLLSHHGEAMHAFKDDIFRVHNYIKKFGEDKLSDKRLSESARKIRLGHLEQIYDAIKETMRLPTLKAILNWGFDPQLIGADSVLIDSDRALIRQWSEHRQTLLDMKNGPITSAHAHLVEDIMPLIPKEYHEIVYDGLRDDATEDARLQSLAILDYFDNEHGPASQIGSKSFVIPYYANILTPEKAQYVEDKIELFRKLYHITPQGLLSLDGEKLPYRVRRDMKTYEIDTPFLFVQRRLEELLGNNYIVTPAPNNFFEVVEAIPVEKFLSKDVLNLPNRDEIFYNTFFVPGIDLETKANLIKKLLSMPEITSVFQDYYDYEFEDKVNRLSSIIDRRAALMERFYESEAALVDPTTGEVLVDRLTGEIYDSELLSFWYTIFDTTQSYPASYYKRDVHVSDLIDISFLSEDAQKYLDNLYLKIEDDDVNYEGYFDKDTGTIVVANSADDAWETFIHEVNHALQSHYGISEGFNTQTALMMRDFLAYIVEKYPAYIAAACNRPDIIELVKNTPLLYERVRAGEFGLLADELDLFSNYLAYPAYLLVQGEMWSRSHVHNKKSHAFAHLSDRTGEYILSPDGKEKFYIRQSDVSRALDTIKEPKLTPTIQEALTLSALEETFRTAFHVAFLGDEASAYTTKTYHSPLTKYTADEIIDTLVAPGLLPTVRARLTVNDLIKDPTRYLNEDVLVRFDEDYTEGRAYGVIRSYIESIFNGISVDMKANTGEYILVDDNAFNDLYEKTIAARVGSDKVSLANRWGGLPIERSATLSRFYDETTLQDLGVDPTIKVLVGPDYSSATTRDKSGKLVIHLKARKNTSDKDFLLLLNHEFRHVLQNVFGFERGFLPDITVTDQMLEDCKKEVPNIFNMSEINEILERNGLTGKNREKYIAQHFMYLLVSGELNAYGILGEYINGKPIRILRNGKSYTIFSPWYDAKTNYGKYEVTVDYTLSDLIENYNKTKKKTAKTDGDKAKKKTDVIDTVDETVAEPTIDYSIDIETVKSDLIQRRLEAEVDSHINSLKSLASSSRARETLRRYLLSDTLDDQIKKLQEKKDRTKDDDKHLIYLLKVAKKRVKIDDLVQEYVDELDSISEKEVRRRHALIQERLTGRVKREDFVEHEKAPSNKKRKKSPTKKDRIVVPYDKKARLDVIRGVQGKRVRINKKMLKDSPILKAYFGKLVTPNLLEFMQTVDKNRKLFPQEIIYAIKRGKLTESNFYEWFRKVDLDTLDQETFEIINEHFFKNDEIQSTDHLTRIVDEDIPFWYAASLVLRKHKLMDSDFLKKTNIPDFMNWLKSQNNDLYKEIESKRFLFLPRNENIDIDDASVKGYSRIAAMKFFDGTPLGAFYYAHTVRSAYYSSLKGLNYDTLSFDTKVEGKDNDDMTVANIISEDDVDTSAGTSIGNDLVALYEREAEYVSRTTAIEFLKRHTYEGYVETFLTAREKWSAERKDRAREYLLDLDRLYDTLGELEKEVEAGTRDVDDKELRFLQLLDKTADRMSDQLTEYSKKLNGASLMSLRHAYLDTISAIAFGLSKSVETVVDEDTGRILSGKRERIQGRIKDYGKRLIEFVTNKKYDFSWRDVPDNIKDLFEVNTVDGKTVYSLKKDAWQVGRGKVTVSGVATSKTKGFHYSRKTNLDEEYDLSHDRTEILKNDQRLRRAVREAKALMKEREELKQSMDKKNDSVKIKNRKRNTVKKDVDENGVPLYHTEIDVGKSKKQKGKKGNTASRTGELPNIIDITSTRPMPERLKSILDVTFDKMADTLVQYANKDKNTGEYWHKKDKPKNFESDVQHEVRNIDKFFEINVTEFSEMTRSEALAIIEYIKTTPFTLSQLNSKFITFLQYTEAYIERAARYNHNNWNFSEDELNDLVQLRATISSGGGFIQNSTRQALDIINPYATVASRALDNFGIVETEVEDLFKSVDELQHSKDADARKKAAARVLEKMKVIEDKMIDPSAKTPWKRRWSKIKSFRYMAMLSNPATWVRNLVSNYMLSGLNFTADKLSGFLFAKRGYKDGQWDLSVTADPEIVRFIKDEVLVHEELFDPLFENQNKYDSRVSGGKVKTKNTFAKHA